MKRFRLIPTRNAGHQSLHVWGDEQTALQAAHELFREHGIPILVCEAPLDGVVTTLDFVGVKKRRRRSSKPAATVHPRSGGNAPASFRGCSDAGAESLARELSRFQERNGAVDAPRGQLPGHEYAGWVNDPQGEE